MKRKVLRGLALGLLISSISTSVVHAENIEKIAETEAEVTSEAGAEETGKPEGTEVTGPITHKFLSKRAHHINKNRLITGYEHGVSGKQKDAKGGIPMTLESQLKKSISLMDNTEHKNVVLSTFSLDQALALATNGANGKTKEQLEAYIGSDIDSYNKFSYEYINGLDKTLHVANSVWLNDGYNLIPEYAKNIEKHYRAECSEVDISSVDTVKQINSWVNKNTDGMIPKIYDNPLSPDNIAVLINAISFDGQWAEKFGTVIDNSKFTNSDSTESNVTLLFQSVEDGNYWENDDYLAFKREYAGDRYSFIGILPKNESSEVIKPSLASLISKENLKTAQQLDYYIPKFEFEYNVGGIIPSMMESGVEIPFTDAADFKGLASRNSHISDIIQVAKIQLDENGTKAAAVTAIQMMDNAIAFDDIADTVEITCDRPFVFIIMDDRYSVPLFVGKVENMN